MSVCTLKKICCRLLRVRLAWCWAIANPLAFRKACDDVYQADAVTEIEHLLASGFAGVLFRSDAGNHPAAKGDLQLLAGLNPLEQVFDEALDET
jgi:hypothetical protein